MSMVYIVIRGFFMKDLEQAPDGDYLVFSAPQRRKYTLNIITNNFTLIETLLDSPYKKNSMFNKEFCFLEFPFDDTNFGRLTQNVN